MGLKLYNTLTGHIEDFHPLNPEQVTMYVCGPTVYDRIHLGNARPVVIFDILYRLLRHHYPKVTYVRNLTDVDDKINDRAKERGISIHQLTSETTEMFHADTRELNVLSPNLEPRATAHISEMINMIQVLMDKGHAYASDGHVLFDVTTYDQYGALSRRDIDQMIAGARVEVAHYKRNAHDFVLWKPSDHETPGWESPWGYGRPGWHIECSAMSRKYLGATFDIHGGGRDLVFPHHENEIAQSKGCDGHDSFAHYWIHNEMLTVNGEKMSKSLGNFITLYDALQTYPGEVIRFMLLSTHYRKPLNWTNEALSFARSTLDKFYNALQDFQENADAPLPLNILEALDADLNTPLAIAYLHEITTQIHKSTDAIEKATLQAKLKVSGEFLGLFKSTPSEWFQGADIKTISPDEIEALITERADAKACKDFSKADAIRKQLDEQGIILLDSPQGTTWRKK